jgi:archaellum biogenesis ATPase FlaH
MSDSPVISIYKNSFDTEGTSVYVDKVLEYIKDGRWMVQIGAIRSAVSKEVRDELKRNLPSPTFSGLFSKRGKDTLEKYSGIISMDIDQVPPALMSALVEALEENVYVYSAFVSPGGKGIKILFRVDTEGKYHEMAWDQIRLYLENNYAISADIKAKDVSRICYVSWDPDLYLNTKCEIFPVVIDPDYQPVKKLEDREAKFSGKTVTTAVNYIFKTCVKWTERKFQYHEGRNTFCHALACNLNRCGVMQEDAIFLVCTNFRELDNKETSQCVVKAYRQNAKEHNTVDVYKLEDPGSLVYPEAEAYSDDLVDNDLMEKTMVLLKAGIDPRVISALVIAYGNSYNEVANETYDEIRIRELMNKAVLIHREKLGGGNGLSTQTISQMLTEVVENFNGSPGASTRFLDMDRALGGSFKPGNIYGMIGMQKTFKSIIASYWAAENAKEGIASLYVNGEMSALQFLDRLVSKELNVELEEGLKSKEITADSAATLISEMSDILKDNVIIHNGNGFTGQQIADKVFYERNVNKRDIRIIFIDGLTQMAFSKGGNEITSAIDNSAVLKEVAKVTDTAIVFLVHTSGNCVPHFRHTAENIRGGQKLVANMDGYFCTSRIIDPELTRDDDVFYKEDLMYLRYVDKRGTGAIVSNIIDIKRPMKIIATDIHPESVEVKLK